MHLLSIRNGIVQKRCIKDMMLRPVAIGAIQRQQHGVVGAQSIASNVVSRRSMVTWNFNSSSLHDPNQPKQKTQWQPEENADIQRVTRKAIIHELTKQQTATIENVVPWFLNVMPEAYFRQVDEGSRMDHLRAVAAVRDANMDIHLNLKTKLSDGRRVFTYIRPTVRHGRLLNLLHELPWDHNNAGYLPLSRVQTFCAEDSSMSLNVFTYGYQKLEVIDVESCGSHILDYAATVLDNSDDSIVFHDRFLLERDSLLEYLHKCSDSYISRSDPRRFLQQRALYETVSGTEGVAVNIEEADVEEFDDCYWMDIATSNALPQFALEHALRILNHNHFDVVRSHLDVVSDGDNGKVTLLRLVARPVGDCDTSQDSLERIARQLKRTKWLDPYTMDLAVDKYPDLLSLRHAEIITAFCSLMHPIMSKQHPIIYSKGNILDYVTNKRHIVHASNIANLFMGRFDPDAPLSDAEFESRSDALRIEIHTDVEDSAASELLLKMIDIISQTLKTNIFMHDRYALGLRLNPEIMFNEEDDRECPFGVIFIHGRRFNGYHVRFKDIARGGLRLVTPATSEQHALESARQFDECYGLAYAQQLKNKDIPEGGSKAVCLMDVSDFAQAGKAFVMRKSVKSFADVILDLIVDTEETRKSVVDLVGHKEVLYLGPDEQVIPQDIDWIVSRAAQRGYSIPAAFMSSKPRAGINHKEYGVTSEGVNVFLDTALRRALGIDPTTTSFTIKMTGGPDGDVAGNELKILFREYGDNAKIVGIADHSGCAEDPEGLNRGELMRLVSEGLCISNFEKSKLNAKGELFLADNEQGLRKRNTMHNRLEADAFVPAGGRPNTIDSSNYRQFLKQDGTPSSSLIVEGANLFITPAARQALYDEAGVMIVKDSSANKCGVICSSYEICSAMLLSEDEFFDNKEAIVEDVLVKLRQLASLEAELLFREFDNYEGSLPMMSETVSRTINTATDALTDALEVLPDEEKQDFMPLIKAHLPKKLADMSFDRMGDGRVPDQYIKNAMASCLASKLVYKEGTKFIESQPREKLAKIALNYLHKEKEITALVEALEDSDVPASEKETISKLLQAGGTRTSLAIF